MWCLQISYYRIAQSSATLVRPHIERMPGTRYTKKIDQGEVVGTMPIGRPKKSWLEGVQDVLNRDRIQTSINKRAVQAKVMKLRDAQVECQDRARWRKVCSDLQ